MHTGGLSLLFDVEPFSKILLYRVIPDADTPGAARKSGCGGAGFYEKETVNGAAL